MVSPKQVSQCLIHQLCGMLAFPPHGLKCRLRVMDRWLVCAQIAPCVVWHQSKPLTWWSVNKTEALAFYSSCSLTYHESGWVSATFPHPLGGKVLYSEGEGA